MLTAPKGFAIYQLINGLFQARDLSGEQQQSCGSPNHYSATDRMRAQLSSDSGASVMVTGREGSQVAAEESSKLFLKDKVITGNLS
jgi:hypothetical protein